MRIWRRLFRLMVRGDKEIAPPMYKDPPHLETARQNLVKAQTDFFEAVKGVVQENERLKRGGVHAKKDT